LQTAKLICRRPRRSLIPPLRLCCRQGCDGLFGSWLVLVSRSALPTLGIPCTIQNKAWHRWHSTSSMRVASALLITKARQSGMLRAHVRCPLTSTVLAKQAEAGCMHARAWPCPGRVEHRCGRCGLTSDAQTPVPQHAVHACLSVEPSGRTGSPRGWGIRRQPSAAGSGVSCLHKHQRSH
jgi:hypothetical protein